MSEGLLDADGSVYKPKLLGRWQLLVGRSSLMTCMDLRGISSSTLYNQVGFRVAVDPTDPEDWDTTVGPGTGQNADGSYPESFDLSGAGYDGYTWVQPAILTKITSGQTYNCQGRLWSTVLGAEWVAARQRLGVEQGASVYRTFDSGDTSRPNAWQSGSAQTEVTSDQRKAFNLATTTTDRLLIQAGLKYDSDAAANGAVDVLVAART